MQRWPAEAERPTRLAWVLVATGSLGLLASATLLIERIALLADPSYRPSCSINPVLSCGSVMTTEQASAFGFPNPVIGVAAFAVLMTVGAALLAGATFRDWFWWGLQAGTVFGVVFVHWLVFQSLYRIGALCPYCMVVWVVTITAFVAVTLHNLAARRLVLADRLAGLGAWGPTIVTVWLVGIAGLITVEFWDYWSTLLP